jgi:hypothetical protein
MATNPLTTFAVLSPLLAIIACSADGSNTPAPDNRAPDGGPTRHEDASVELPLFSFFVTSLKALQELSGSQAGFGGDLRYGETGPGAGLRGADKICSTIAERSLPGAGAKEWRAFLSATTDENGKQVDAIDRVGEGPWYDRLGRLVAPAKQDLIGFRPAHGDSAIVNDLPNEDGVPNHQPDPTSAAVDNHDTLTGSNTEGRLYSPTATCLDWTTSEGSAGGRPRVGHSLPSSASGGFPFPTADGGFPFPFPRRDGGLPFGLMRRDGGPTFGFMSPNGAPPSGFPPGFPTGEGGTFTFPPGFALGEAGIAGLVGANFDYGHWISSLDEAGCGAGVSIIEMGAPNPANPTVGSGGGYGGFYCFALSP